MKEIFSYLLGPKAENMDLFHQFIQEALDDHMFWRRNFHPKDLPVVSSFTKSDEAFRRFNDNLRDNLFQFLSDSKSGVPFFSSRYVGHMQTDLLIPALIGYFSAMLFNNNNVADESSPVTARYENEVVAMLLKMVGSPQEGWGYLTTGGTAANIFSLWAVRNLRTLPFSIKAALSDVSLFTTAAENVFEKGAFDHPTPAKSQLEALFADISKNLEVETANGTLKPLTELTIWELMNLPVSQLCSIRGSMVSLTDNVMSFNEETSASIFFDELIGAYQLKTLGFSGFRKLVNDYIPEASGLVDSPWRVYVSATSHYSWPKGADILGFGHESVVKIPHLPSFDMDVDALKELLLEDLKINKSEPSVWPFFMSSIFGTTEEGALDNLTEIDALLKDLRNEHGLTLWHHADACYGGYLASMVRTGEDSADDLQAGAIDEPGTLKNWLFDCGTATGLDEDECKELIEISETGSGAWLPWQEVIERTKALTLSDSISIDPHKLGYIPYPAGAILFQNRRAREVMSTDAPYLWADSDEEEGFTGRFTLEGSRSGAAAAACWLAHKTITLDQNGHGRLIALSILAARKLYVALNKQLTGTESKASVALVHQPQSNIVCYAPYHLDFLTVKESNEIASEVLSRLHPKNEIRHYMAVGTDLPLSTGSSLEEGMKAHSHFREMLDREGGKAVVKVIRSVVMGPYSLVSMTKSDQPGEGNQPVFTEYARHLAVLIEDTAKELYIKMAKRKVLTWERHVNMLIVDDDKSTVDHLKNCIAEADKLWKHYEYADTEESALKAVENDSVPLDIVFLDIDMRGSSDSPKGKSDSGFEVYKAILKRNAKNSVDEFRVKLVFFFTRGYTNWESKIAELNAEVPGGQVRTLYIDRNATTGKATEEHRQQVIQSIYKELSQLNIK